MKPASPPKRLADLATERPAFNYGFLDDFAKRELRRRMLKAVAIPGYQVPYASRELPIARGWGTGGLQVSLTLTKPTEVVKVIDQGADDSVNAANLRRFIARMTGAATTTDALRATLIQSRHRIPEEILDEDQVLVLQVPDPEPLRGVEFNISAARELHAYKDYGLIWLKLYEQMARFGRFIQGASYPAMIHDRFVMSPSPIPRWDTPKLHQAKHLTLLSAGREKRLYAVPPYTDARPLEFEDRYFQVEDQRDWVCSASGAQHQFMNENPTDDGGSKYEISDTGYLEKILARRDGAAQEPGPTYYDHNGAFYHPGFIKSTNHDRDGTDAR